MAAVAPLLTTSNLSRHFGGVAAVDGVDFQLAEREIRAIIGPNGAGKTTLVSLICGRVAADVGQVQFKGRNISRLKSWQRVRAGIVYTFQITSIFRSLTCIENVALAVQSVLAANMASHFFLSEATIRARGLQALASVGLSDASERRADELPYGHQKLLEVAMSLALQPQLLILDEPTQGLAEGEIETLGQHVRAIAERMTVLIIEHNMPVVLELAERVTVMDRGRILAEGTPAEIESDARVREAYLGH